MCIVRAGSWHEGHGIPKKGFVLVLAVAFRGVMIAIVNNFVSEFFVVSPSFVRLDALMAFTGHSGPVFFGE